MTGPVIAIRAEPGLAATLQAGRAAGLPMIGWPLFEIVPVPWKAPGRENFDALLIGSANAFRHGGPQLAQLRDLPVHAVGASTAEAAEMAGFSAERIGEGGLQSLLDSAGDEIRYLRLAGAERVALAPPPGIAITERIVYRSETRPLEAGMAARLRAGGVVLLHSAAAARHFAAECSRLGTVKDRIAIACLGPRVAQAAGMGWAACRSAAKPAEPALLELARDMCH